MPRFNLTLGNAVFAVVPALAAVAASLWLAGRLEADPQAESRQIRAEEVIAQDRLLVDAIWSGLETLKAKALGLRQAREAQLKAGLPLSVPDGVILHWAELELGDGALKAVRQSARNPEWKPGADPAALESYYLQAALSKLSLTELKQNGVAMLRLKQDPARNHEWIALGFESPAGVVLTLVDPVEALPIFRRWSARSEGGKLRGYLVGGDGFVLAHSQRPYVAASFGGTQVYQEGVRQLLQGKIVSGAGVYKGIDGVSVAVAYARPGTLPIAAVVERVTSESLPTLASSPLAAIARKPGEAAKAFGGMMALCLGVALLMGRRRVGARSESESESESASVRGRRDDAAVGRKSAETASKLLSSPVLFFAYQPKLRAAVFESAAGYEGGGELRGLSFGISGQAMERIALHGKDGKPASLSDDPALAIALAKRLGIEECEAWPLIGSDRRLIGILVALHPDSWSSTNPAKVGKISGIQTYDA